MYINKSDYVTVLYCVDMLVSGNLLTNKSCDCLWSNTVLSLLVWGK